MQKVSRPASTSSICSTKNTRSAMAQVWASGRRNGARGAASLSDSRSRYNRALSQLLRDRTQHRSCEAAQNDARVTLRTVSCSRQPETPKGRYSFLSQVDIGGSGEAWAWQKEGDRRC